MRIAIDARELAGQPTGVGRYLSEILREWETMPEALQHEYVLCAPAETRYDGPLRVTAAVAPGSGTLWEQRALPRMARRARADVLFCAAYSGPIFDSTPLVVAIHDVSFAAHPEWFRWREGVRRRLVTRASARRAARVLTLTEFSKREIVEHLGVPPDRVEVVQPGVRQATEGPAPAVGQDARVGQGFSPDSVGPGAGVGQGFSPANEPLLLYVGSIFNRRHVPETIRGFERLARRRPEARLAIVGDNRTVPRVDLERLVRDARVSIHSYVTDRVLRGMYERARAFVFLSEYEGFGLTPLEALAAGIPIVVLDTPVAREVYGDAAIYVAVPEPRRIETALELALFDDVERRRVLAHAGALVSRYSWQRCATRVLQALTDAAESGPRIANRGPQTADLGTRTADRTRTAARGLRTAARAPRLTIVIVSYNGRADLERCLESLAAHKPIVDHQIVVVDNASTDDTIAALRARWPGVRLIEAGGNLGFSRANNIGIRRSAGELVLLLNGDTLVPRGAIDALVAALDSRPDAAVAGPRLVDAQGRAELSFGRMISPLNEVRQKLRARWLAERLTSAERDVDWVSGACLLVRRADAEAAGLLDERFFMYTEDVDFCAAVRARGRKVLFTPQAEIVHLRGRSRQTAPHETEAAYRRSHIAFYRKHHPRWAPLLRLYLRLRGRLPDNS